MFEAHPSIEDFENLLRGASRPARHAGSARAIRHLLGECGPCRERLNGMGWSGARLGRLIHAAAGGDVDPEQMAQPIYDYSRAFARADRAISAFLAPEPAMAAEDAQLLLADLDSLSAGERIERVKSGGPFAVPALIRLLVDRSHAARYQDSEQMLHFADLARIAAEGCSPDSSGGEMKLADLRTRAWGQYGNALRVCGRPREAEQALTTARGYRKGGTGDPLLHAWLLERIVSLLIFQGQLSAAIESCDEAGQIYDALGESHLLAGTMIQKGIAAIYSGEAEQAVHILNQAIPMIDDEEDPQLLLAACHNLIWCYVDLDRPDQALTLYNEARELYQEVDDPLLLLRATWQEGRLLRDLGHLRAAETALIRARKGYQEKGLSYEVALVLLDLAAVYVKLGLAEEVKRTALMAVPIFHALRVKVETLAALLQLQQVADQEQQALELIRTLNARVESMAKNKSAH